MTRGVRSIMLPPTLAGRPGGEAKDGKPLVGAAKTAFVTKCKKDSCEPKAVSSDGKPLSGAAKNSFMKKCQNDS